MNGRRSDISVSGLKHLDTLLAIRTLMMPMHILLEHRPNELENSTQVFNENQEEWLERTARINNLQVYAEAVLEQQAQAPRRGYYVPPPDDALIPPTRPTLASEMGPSACEEG